MRITRLAQISIFETYSKHEYGIQLKALSCILDDYPEILTRVGQDLIDTSRKPVGRTGLTVENIFRCLLLKQQLKVSYQQLAFHLSDSTSYRSFVRLAPHLFPGKSVLQSTIRRISPDTLEAVHKILSVRLFNQDDISLEKIRVDSTVVKSNITPPSDSQLLNDAVRVLSRHMAKSLRLTGIKTRFTDKRKDSKSLAFRIFNAKNTEKEALYPSLLKIMARVLKQVDSALIRVKETGAESVKKQKWIESVEYYRTLALKVVDQTQRRIIENEKVPSSEKIVSLFEPHTDIIIKGFREVIYGHKINLSSDRSGFITHLSIEKGNPSDKDLFMPVLTAHHEYYNGFPEAVVGDGGYASQSNVLQARELGIKHVVFHKRVGISYLSMGVKAKTFKILRNFRAGVEGNISELKRAFGLSKAIWKGHDGFKAFVWSSVISYNLVRLTRMQSG